MIILIKYYLKLLKYEYTKQKRFYISGVDSSNNYQILKSITPAAELYGYSTDLRSLTQGRATFITTFSSYQPVPANVQMELVKQLEKELV